MRLKSVLRKLEQSGRDNDAIQPDKSKKYLNITRETGEFLSVLVKATKSERILEIGTSNGYSTIWLAAALPEHGTVTTIEISQEKAREALSNFAKAGVADKIELVQKDARAALQGLGDPYDFIFLDADRSTYMDMLPDILRLLQAGGLMVCDNAISHESELVEFTSCLQSLQNFSTSLVPVGKGEFLAHKS